MIVNVEHKEDNRVKLKDLQVNTFKYGDDYYLDTGCPHFNVKDYGAEDTLWLVYNLITGTYRWFYGSELVTPVKDVTININD